uniref:Uncharacterized protein n=1 Tax=Avena sativa TaxID=4498 RepID=A0ACD5U8B7_AVESA
MEENLGDNRYGHFAVLEPTNGPVTGFPTFFVKDPSRNFEQNHLGVKFKTAGRVQVHVHVLSNGKWLLHSFDPLVSSEAVTFQRTPYCVRAGSRLYMMYLLHLVVWFDMEGEIFGAVPLPSQTGMNVNSCLQYTGGPHPEGDLAIVHLDNGRLVRWVLIRNGDMAVWNQGASIDLIGAFGYLMNTAVFNSLSCEPSEWRAIQVRSVSPDGWYVLISVSVIYGLFVVDMYEETVEAVPNLNKMGRVFPLSEYWLPKP